MIDDFQTWSDMADRHAMEKAEAVCALRDLGLTQTQAANKLGVPLGHLNSHLTRNKIPWDYVRQGKPTKYLEREQAAQEASQ